MATFQSSIGYDLRVVCSGLGFFKPPLKIDFKGVSSLAAANRIDPDWELLLCTIVPTCGLYFSKEVAEVYDG